jgi:hypothetical protein
LPNTNDGYPPEVGRRGLDSLKAGNYRIQEPAAMSAARPRLSSYRLHKPSGLAVVTLAGCDHYLGRDDTPESRVEYDRRVGEWLASGRRRTARDQPAAGDLTVNDRSFGQDYNESQDPC